MTRERRKTHTEQYKAGARFHMNRAPVICCFPVFIGNILRFTQTVRTMGEKSIEFSGALCYALSG